MYTECMQDIIWKRIIESLFQDFVAFFMPDLYTHIDFTQKPTFLDKEFQSLFPEAKKGRRYLDKLVKVFLKSGQVQWVLIHAEVQGYKEEQFSERMFRYFYRIFDKYQQKIVSLAILTDENRDWKPERFEYKFFQTELVYNYRTCKLLEQDEVALKTSNNPFALAVLASLYTIRSKRNQDRRFKFKIELTEMLLEKNYSNDRIKAVFLFIQTLLRLNDEIKQDLFMEEVHKMATANKKRLEPISDFEEAVLRKGRKEGEAKGERKGELKAHQQTARKMKIDGVSVDTISKYTGLTEAEINKL